MPISERYHLLDSNHKKVVSLRKALASRRILSGVEVMHTFFEAKTFKQFKEDHAGAVKVETKKPDQSKSDTSTMGRKK